MLNYPPQMLAHEEEHVLDDLKARLENQNMDFKTYLSLRGVEEEAFVADEIRPAAKQRLERSLIVDSLIDAENLKLDQEMLKDNIGEILNEVIVSGEAEEMQKQMGKDAFTRAISMEGVQKTMNTLLKNRLKLIATGQPIPEEVESDEEAEPILDAEQPDEETPVAITDVEKAEANEVDSQVDEVKETVESTEAESADGI